MMTASYIPAFKRWWLVLITAAVLAFLIIPVFIVIPVSFSDSKYLGFPPEAYSLRWYRNYWNSSEWLSATRASLVAASLTTLVATPIGIATAYSMRSLPPRVAGFVQLLMLLPMVVPSILIGIGVFYLYIQLKLVNSMFGIVAAHTLLALPFVVLTMQAAFATFDFRQEQAAMSLGASRFSAFMRVTLPQVRSSAISGGLFAFIISLDEVVIGLFVAGGSNTVITRKMFVALRDAVDPTVAAISTLFIAVSLSLLTASLFTRSAKR
ncbi:putative spermidine/putrescine transport system permease protein [Rhodoligotrophos appendicifer]|uniref:ABC transporter permease n=1 Tax=Rhodoligotrophos appendicifer TaxID=987056 RepID=UPI001478079C|nr:ABC transporter permease [Rhodoligotrophos appendicifer]